MEVNEQTEKRKQQMAEDDRRREAELKNRIQAGIAIFSYIFLLLCFLLPLLSFVGGVSLRIFRWAAGIS